MGYGRFIGGQHFSKKALKADNKVTAPQVKYLTKLGYTKEQISKLSYDKASYIIKKNKRQVNE